MCFWVVLEILSIQFLKMTFDYHNFKESYLAKARWSVLCLCLTYFEESSL